MIYFLSIILMLMVYYCPASSQQLPRFSQYFSNEFIVNPAVAGYDGRTIVNLAARKQWLGFSEYTPNSYALSLEGRILKKTMNVRGGIGGSGFRKSTKGRIGLGGLVYHDVNGAIERTGGQFSYAYHIFINNAQLSFGLTGNVFQYRIDAEKARLKNPDIDVLNGLIGKSTLIPDANVGINYMTEKYHLGVAACQLFQSKIKIGNGSDFKESEETRLLRQYYFLGDYMFTSRRQWEWQPSVLIVMSEKPQVQAEVTLKAYYNRQYWFGVSGRTSGDIVIMAGVKLLKYYFGYSYDYGFNGISRYTFGSHEICITAKFGDTARRYRWLDRY
ncbi:MAG TPA: type IX secretion system membrane protein PorP/SprF [Bacteroidales bacterium]|nr:type IX secretion system membrane protein PorP/SprF [Bacteroidales bacterium]